MFCRSCGSKLDDNANFCRSCGQKVDWSNTTNTADYPIAKTISSRYVWALATVPLLVSLVIDMFGGFPFSTIVAIILNSIFTKYDERVLRCAGIDLNRWYWLGAILVPVYLLLRALTTDKNFVYFIVNCGIFLLVVVLDAILLPTGSI